MATKSEARLEETILKSPKKLADLTLKQFKETDDFKEIFQMLVEHYQEVFDNSEEVKPMIRPQYKIEMSDDIQIKPLHLYVPRCTTYTF